MILVLMALGLETISLMNAHRADWGKSALEVIRNKDKQLLALVNQPDDAVVELSFPDVAFAPVGIDVRHSDSIYVISHWPEDRGSQ